MSRPHEKWEREYLKGSLSKHDEFIFLEFPIPEYAPVPTVACFPPSSRRVRHVSDVRSSRFLCSVLALSRALHQTSVAWNSQSPNQLTNHLLCGGLTLARTEGRVMTFWVFQNKISPRRTPLDCKMLFIRWPTWCQSFTLIGCSKLLMWWKRDLFDIRKIDSSCFAAEPLIWTRKQSVPSRNFFRRGRWRFKINALFHAVHHSASMLGNVIARPPVACYQETFS